MKNILIALLLLFSTTYAFAGDSDFVWTEVVQTDTSLTDDQLFNNAMTWLTYNFKSVNDVVQYSNAKEGKIIGKASMDAYIVYFKNVNKVGFISFNITIQVKDGRYKYTLDNFVHTCVIQQCKSIGALPNYDFKASFTMGPNMKQTEEIRQNAIKTVHGLIESLKEGMNKKGAKNEDW